MGSQTFEVTDHQQPQSVLYILNFQGQALEWHVL